MNVYKELMERYSVVTAGLGLDTRQHEDFIRLNIQELQEEHSETINKLMKINRKIEDAETLGVTSKIFEFEKEKDALRKRMKVLKEEYSKAEERFNAWEATDDPYTPWDDAIYQVLDEMYPDIKKKVHSAINEAVQTTNKIWSDLYRFENDVPGSLDQYYLNGLIPRKNPQGWDLTTEEGYASALEELRLSRIINAWSNGKEVTSLDVYDDDIENEDHFHLID